MNWQKNHNYQNFILKLIRENRISRIKIAELTCLNPTTVGKLVEGLIKQGVIEEKGLDASSGGRSSIIKNKGRLWICDRL